MDIVRSCIIETTLSNSPSVSDDKRCVSVETRAIAAGDSVDAAALISVQARVTVWRRAPASSMILRSGVLRSRAWMVKGRDEK
jgi:hypothetical protein